MISSRESMKQITANVYIFMDGFSLVATTPINKITQIIIAKMSTQITSSSPLPFSLPFYKHKCFQRLLVLRLLEN